jgi:anti-sigma B factor antagonist
MDEIDAEMPAPPPLRFEIGSDEHGTPVVRISGELDIATVPQLDEALEPVLARRPQRLVLDLEELRFADSSALAKLILWRRQVGEMELRKPSPLLRRVIQSMGLSDTLEMSS